MCKKAQKYQNNETVKYEKCVFQQNLKHLPRAHDENGMKKLFLHSVKTF